MSHLSRRNVLKGTAAAGIGTLVGTGMVTSAAGSDALPNFVIVFCDDLGYGDPSCYGSPLIKTPTIDGIARRGMRLTDCYSASPVCTPSRAALLTGCYAPRVNLPHVLFPGEKNGLSAQETTLAEYLKKAGYATACIGKWHLGDPSVRPGMHPMDHGFDHFFGLPYSNDMDPLPLYDDRKIIERPPEQQSLTRRYAEQATTFIREHADEPFFVYLPHTQPHEPLASEFAGRSAAGAHGDSVEEIDHYLGTILDELDRQGVRDRTFVMFTSDNGPWYVGSAGDLSGRKVETYEGGVRVPCVIEWPDVIPAGVTSDQPTCLVDILPTLLEAIDIEPDPDRTIDGHSILPALSGNRRVDRGDIIYYDGETSQDIANCNAIRRGDWKLHLRRVPGPYYTGRQFDSNDETPQLFNLASDPEESYDLSERYPQLVAKLTDRLNTYHSELRADHAKHYGAA